MESSARPPDAAEESARRTARWWPGLLKGAAGVALLAALYLWGRIDLAALAGLVSEPWTVALCTLVLFLTLPLSALRWGLLLRALGISIGFSKLFHFVGIGMVVNLFLLGSMGGDAARGIYAWRAAGGASARIAISLVADRLIGLIALVSIAALFAAFNWHRMQHVPALAALGLLLFALLAAVVAGAALLLLGSRLVGSVERWLSAWPRLALLFGNVRDLLSLVLTHPGRLVAAFALALAIHACVVAGAIIIAGATGIGRLAPADYVFAMPLTLVANAVPLTPNGIGVGEAAFDQICRWLEPEPSGAAYSSVFFALRVIAMLACLPGFVSFALYRNRAGSDASTANKPVAGG
jgi:uncharacterized protein (TIRG00374 family)